MCIDLQSIATNPNNPRKVFDSVALAELSASIKEKGVLQPIVVRPLSDAENGLEYQLVCGERRWRAAGMAGLCEIPAIIRDLTDDEAMDVAITENLQRKDVSPLEEADAFNYLLDKGSSIADLCGRFGKSEFYVRGRLKLLSMSEDFRKLLDAGEISISQAMEIVKFDGDVQARMYADHFASDEYNSWRTMTGRNIYKRGLEIYTKQLGKYKFDKTDCEKCPNCTKNSCLFAAIEEAACQDSVCLQLKDQEYKIGVALKIQKQHPEADFMTWRKESKMKSELERLGYEVRVLQSRLNRIGAVVSKDLKRRVDSGEIQLFICIDDEPYLGYAEKGFATGLEGTPNAKIQALRDKDSRNKGKAEEKTVSDVRDAIKNMDADTLSAGELTAYESQLIQFTLIKNLKKEQQEKLGKIQFYTMSDEEAWNVVMNISPEQTSFIHRCTILNQVGDHTRKDFKTELFFDWVNARDASIVPAADLKNQETYLKRHERIEARIAEIEMAEVK